MVVSVTMSSAVCNTEQTAWLADSGGGVVGNGVVQVVQNSSSFSHSVESSAAEESDNSSTSSSSSGRRQNLSNIGCITTHNVTNAIRPEKKMSQFDPLQFVKIQNNELSKKAVEQIKLAEEEKITKEKIKEVEEEWQNNLMNWKSKRKINKNSSDDEMVPAKNAQQKTKTFREILKEKASSGGRIGYDLHRYADVEYDNELDIALEHHDIQSDQSLSSDECTSGAMNIDARDDMNMDLIEQRNNNAAGKNNCTHSQSSVEPDRSALGDIVVFDTTLLHEFSVNANCDSEQEQLNPQQQPQQQYQHEILQEQRASPSITADMEQPINSQHHRPETDKAVDAAAAASCSDMKQSTGESINNPTGPQTMPHSNESAEERMKVQVPITQWKSSPQHSSAGRNVVPESGNEQYHLSDDYENNHHNSSYEDDEDELDEELEKLRIDQERSFKAKLHAFENLAKQEEEAVKKAKESYRMRTENRAKLAKAEKSRSLGNLQSKSIDKMPVSATMSGSSLIGNGSSGHLSTQQAQSHSPVVSAKSLQNLSESPSKFISGNSVVYNFTNKPTKTEAALKNLIATSSTSTPAASSLSPTASMPKGPSVVAQKLSTNAHPAQTQQTNDTKSLLENNIYENINPTQFSSNVLPTVQSQSQPLQMPPAQNQPQLQSMKQVNEKAKTQNPDPISDSNAMRNASQKLLHQQQQIYQNQPPVPQSQLYGNYGDYNSVQQQQQPIMRRQFDEVGLPIPMHITKSTQSGVQHNPIVANGKTYVPMIPIAAQQQAIQQQPQPVKLIHAIKPEEEHLYMNQNQLLMSGANPQMLPPMHFRPNSVVYDSYPIAQQAPEFYGHHAEPNYENNAMLHQKRMLIMDENGIYGEHQFVPQAPATIPPHSVPQMNVPPGGQMHLYSNSAPQYLYYSPKPFSAGPQAIKPIAMKLQQVPQPQMLAPRMAVSTAPSAVLPPQGGPQMGGPRFVTNTIPPQQAMVAQNVAQSPMPVPISGAPGGRVAYNQNHWLLQEAELRRQIDSMEGAAAAAGVGGAGQPPLMKPPPPQGVVSVPPSVQRPPNANNGGFLSVSGKKKCSNCGEELGKGCAAMVVESLSLYYHINCFRCSVCNVQLGNGTVGTDVRVRNNKLHCQNCYSNDEAGLKFSRV